MNTQDLIEKIYPKVLNFIAYKARAKKEVSDKVKKLISFQEIPREGKDILQEAILLKLEEDNLINDEVYAKDFTFSVLNSSKPRGAQYIKRFLYKKGISSQLIDKAVSQINQDDEYELGLTAAQKKLRSLDPKNTQKNKQKLWEYLMRRGFSHGVIGRILENVLDVQ